ncbi:MAG: M48 family metalloprotease [Proteobacteria bacterium]|nr:M48 family metalloprotease [Pseudomonadota bacterium]
MRTVLASFLSLLLLVIGLPAWAQCPPAYDWSGFYPPAILDRVTQRTAPGLRSNFDQVMLPQLTDQERRTLGGVALDLGQREYAQHPMNFYAAQGGRVVLPLSSVRMVSDLTLAVAWLNRHRQPEKKVFDYAAMLAFRGPAPDGVRALPLAALGVPDNASDDPGVEDLFQKLYGDTMVFIMAHELGHLFHGHSANVSIEQSRRQESEADAFAVELMARLHAPPVGIVFYFNMVAPFECPARSTHPMSGQRIARLTAALRDNGPLFVQDKPSPQHELQLLESVIQGLGQVAKLLDDPDIRESMRRTGLASNVAQFNAASGPAAVAPRPRQAFDGNYAGQWIDAKGTALDFRMTLRRKEQTVRGQYEFGMGNVELEGTVTGDQLDYAWRWGSDYFGRGRLKSTADGRLQGTWGYTQRNEGAGTLTAQPR